MFKKDKEMLFVVNGMTCNGCKKRIEKSLLQMDNVRKVSVNLKNGEVRLYSDKDIDIEKVKDVLTLIGYSVKEV